MVCYKKDCSLPLTIKLKQQIWSDMKLGITVFQYAFKCPLTLLHKNTSRMADNDCRMEITGCVLSIEHFGVKCSDPSQMYWTWHDYTVCDPSCLNIASAEQHWLYTDITTCSTSTMNKVHMSSLMHNIVIYCIGSV